MPIGSSGLPITQAAAEQAQLLRSVQQAQERALNQVEAARTQEQTEQMASGHVQQTDGVEGKTIQGESRGAHSFELKKDEEEKKEEAPPEVKPPDPEGRGTTLDLQA